MNNYRQKGETFTYANATGSAISAGDLVMVGALAAVAATDIANGSSGALHAIGVYSIAKDAVTVTQGQKLYYNATSGKLTNLPAQGENAYVGIAWAAAASGTSTVDVKLNAREGDPAGAKKTIGVPLGAITMEDGTALAKQATSVAGFAQLSGKEQVIKIPVNCTSGEALGFCVPIPEDMDPDVAGSLHVDVSKDADNDALTLAAEVYPTGPGDYGNDDIVSSSATSIVAAGSELTFACATVPSTPGQITGVLTLGGTNDGDAVYIRGVWWEYTSR